MRYIHTFKYVAFAFAAIESFFLDSGGWLYLTHAALFYFIEKSTPLSKKLPSKTSEYSSFFPILAMPGIVAFAIYYTATPEDLRQTISDLMPRILFFVSVPAMIFEFHRLERKVEQLECKNPTASTATECITTHHAKKSNNPHATKPHQRRLPCDENN